MKTLFPDEATFRGTEGLGLSIFYRLHAFNPHILKSLIFISNCSSQPALYHAVLYFQGESQHLLFLMETESICQSRAT